MELVAISMVTVLAVALGIECWILSQARRQHVRMAARADEIAARLAKQASTACSSANTSSAAVHGGNRAVPAFALDLIGGGQRTLEQLIHPVRPLMLIFTHPRCGPFF